MKRIFACWPLILACWIIIGCERRKLTYDYRPWCDIRVNVDWTAFGKTPTGMTLMCFPQDGSEPVVITTTETASTVANLRVGKYNILVFNQSPEEFGTIEFRGMDRYETVEIAARETDSQWHLSQTDEGKTVRDPEQVGIDMLEDFEVTYEMMERSAEQYAANRTTETASVTLHPECIISTALVRVRVNGIHNVRSVRGSLGGMAAGHFPTRGETNGGKATHLLEEWEISHDETDYTSGEVTVAFNTFGLPDGHPGATSDIIDVTNRLHISFLLVDNKTVKDFQFDVTERIKAKEGEELTLMVDIGTSPGGDRPEDNPVEIEDVKPENGSEGGFDATVDNWGEEIEIEIPI